MINLSILTLEKELYTGEVESISVPGADGWLTILSNHIPLITPLTSGEIVVRQVSQENRIEIEKGFLEVRPGSEAVILATTHKQ